MKKTAMHLVGALLLVYFLSPLSVQCAKPKDSSTSAAPGSGDDAALSEILSTGSDGSVANSPAGESDVAQSQASGADQQAATTGEKTPPPAEESIRNRAPAESAPNIPLASSHESPREFATVAHAHTPQIEEIIVTAQKREENLQNVPISIQAFTGNALAARGIENTTQLGQSVPGLQFTSTAGFSLIFMRGIGTDQFIPSADPSIATYLDGIYIPNGHGATTSLGNIQRVEVLKGPQGTLFGRNSTGGAISVTTLDPSTTLTGSAESEVATFSSRRIKANLSGPITDWLGVSFSGAYSRQHSYYDTINYDSKKTVSKAGRLKFKIKVADSLTVSLAASLAAEDGQGTVIGNNTKPSLLGSALGIQAHPDNYSADSDFPAYVSSYQYLYYGIGNWQAPRFNVKLLVSDQYIRTSPAIVDFDGSSQPIAAFPVKNEFINVQTAELQFLSNKDTWLADYLEWVGGFYYYQSSAGVNPVDFFLLPNAIQSALKNIGSPLSLPTGLVDLFANTPVGPNGQGVYFRGVLGTRSSSGFVQLTYHASDWLDITAGGRYQRERRFLTRSETGAVSPVDGSEIPLIYFPLQGAPSKNFSPRLVLSAHPADQTLVYTSYSVGFKSGTYNIANIYLPPNYIVPEMVTTYEVGAKSEFFDRQLRLNGAAFYNYIKNMQSGLVSLLSGGAVRFQSVPKSRTRGAEFDLTFIPLPTWDPDLSLSANAAYVDATYTNYPNASGFDGTTGLYIDSRDVSGNRIVRTPRMSGGYGILQMYKLDSSEIEFGIDQYFNSGFFFDSFNTTKENYYTVLNGYASLKVLPWNAKITAFGKNVLDRRYHLQKFNTDFGNITTLAPPIEYGLRLSLEF